MKKIFSLIFLLCFFFGSKAQVVTDIYATGSSGAYKTGYDYYCTWRYANSIYTGYYGYYKGWAVFDLSSIPAGSVITSVVIGYNIGSIYGTGTPVCSTYGYAGDLSTVTSGSTICSDITGGTLLNTTYYGTSIGNHTLPTNPTTQAFVQSNIGSTISIGFTTDATYYKYFYITGETGSGATTGVHAPFIEITYCRPIAGFSATAAPNPICAGKNLKLTGTTTTGVTGYEWIGPSTYTSTNRVDSIVSVTAGASGIYSFIVTDSVGCHDTTTTANVVVNPLPAAITIPHSPICAFSVDSLSDASGSGTWSVTPATIASVTTTTGYFTGLRHGVATVTFTLPTTCKITAPITVNAFPAPITPLVGADSLCMGSTVTLSDTTLADTGTWASAYPSIATVDNHGVVTTVAAGTTIIQYTNTLTGCGPALHTMTVLQMPSYIHGHDHICVDNIDTLTDTITGGHWTSSNVIAGIASTDTGWLTGYAPGNLMVSYTLPNGCYRTMPIMITGAPGPIVNSPSACPGYSYFIADTMAFGTWTSSDTTVARVVATDSIHAIITTTTPGVTLIQYHSCGMVMTDTLLVNELPKPIMGRDSVCIGDTVMLFDSSSMGIWVSGDTSKAVAAAAFGIITGVRYGIDTIFYKLPTGCKTKMHFFVDSLPNPITGTRILCPGSTTTLSSTTLGGRWSTMHKNIDTVVSVTSGVIAGVVAGLDTVVYKTGIGCKTKAPITVNPLPGPILGDTAICSTDSIILSDLTPGGFWTSSNTAVITVDSFSGKVKTVDTNRGFAYVTYTVGATGCTAKTGFTKYAVPHPIIYWNGITGEDSVRDTFLNYQWYDSSTVGAIPGAINNYLAVLYNEVYYVIVTDSLGCVGRSASFYMNSAGVKDVTNNETINIYPNPADETFHIVATNNVDIVMSNLEGKIVLEQKNAKEVNIKNISSGVYNITFFDNKGNKIGTKELIKR